MSLDSASCSIGIPSSVVSRSSVRGSLEHVTHPRLSAVYIAQP